MQAADAPTMRKRVYALIEGMWSLEERLQLTVDRKKRNSYNRVSTKDLKKIKSELARLGAVPSNKFETLKAM